MSFELFVSQLHFLRPWALLLIPLSGLVFICLLRLRHSENLWRQHIDAELLQQLTLADSSAGADKKNWVWAALLASLFISLAWAGPSWEKIPQPVHKKQDALVILLDLSPSMLAEDIKPSRIIRSRYKLIDLLQQRQEGQTALIVYGGEAHIVSPLTDDTATIINLLPALSPGLLPLTGSNTEMAVEKASQLLIDAGHNYGNILLLSDGVVEEAIEVITDSLSGSQFKLSVLAVGSEDGGPIPTRSGFAKDNSGAIVIARLNPGPLKQLSRDNHGLYQQLQHTDDDIEVLQNFWRKELKQASTRLENREFDQWQDQGYWFLIPALLLFLLSFRRGYLLTQLAPGLIGLFVLSGLIAALTNSPASHAQAPTPAAPLDKPASPVTKKQPAKIDPPILANVWQSLWNNNEQRAHQALSQQDYQKADRLFRSPQWRGISKSKQGDFNAAAEEFGQGLNAEDFYNKGNAQALGGKIDQALASYQQSLKLNPNNPDAEANIELLKKLKQQQKDKNDQAKQQDQGQDSDEKKADEQQAGNDQQEPSKQQGKDQADDKNSDSDSNDDKSDNKDPQEQNSDPDNQPDKEPKPSQNDNKKKQQEEELQRQAAKMAAAQANLDAEQQQALEQWLQQVPDDPSGLMRRKFKYQYDQRRRAYQQGRWQPPENNADKRW